MTSLTRPFKRVKFKKQVMGLLYLRSYHARDVGDSGRTNTNTF